MNSIFFRIFLAVLAFTLQFYNGQSSPAQEFSEGSLIINGSKIPVNIYASENLGTFNSFAFKNNGPSELVIVNEDNVSPESEDKNILITRTLQNFEQGKFQFLDKNFKPFETTPTLENTKVLKYILKTPNKINSADEVSLETPFRIWDPSKGIKLGPLTLHFYSLMFVLAFGFGFLLMTKMFKIDHVNQKYMDPLFTWTLIGTILGARLGHVIFYQPELFKEDFWSVFLPIRTKPHLEFTGFSGLASHGATIALILTTLYYSFKIIKKNPFWVYDRLGIVVALGGAFVRMGNFFNSEIIGKTTEAGSPFAILFPQMSDEYGLTVPRYPSQLFEAIGYFLLFVLLWILYRKTNKKYQQGWLFGLFFIILWAIRFFVEFLKEPQGHEFISFGGLNTGQVLSIPFMIAGVVIMLVSKRFKISEAENAKPE